MPFEPIVWNDKALPTAKTVWKRSKGEEPDRSPNGALGES